MIKFIFLGKTKEKWVLEGLLEYQKRLFGFTKFEIVELKDEKISADVRKIKRIEAEKVLAHLNSSSDYFVLLDETGKQYSSNEFAVFMKKMPETGKNLVFVVGGALGVSEELKKKADLLLSLSKMTQTHQMIRVFLIEQIYRAFMINAGREYHK